MTKREEIRLLDRTIKRFGSNSYIGPWLKNRRESIVQDILQDLPIDLMRGEKRIQELRK